MTGRDPFYQRWALAGDPGMQVKWLWCKGLRELMMRDQTAETDFSAFRKKLLNGNLLIGTFQKTPSSMVSEVLGLTGLDAICLDAEHSPFGRMELDACIFALRSAAMPSLVRVPSGSPSEILNALDGGATGVVVPHVCSAEDAQKIASAAQFGRGGRGYSGSTRAAGYRAKNMKTHREDSASATTVIVQIEDIEAVEAVEDIAKVAGIDCLFAGRVDLAVALNADSLNAPEVIEAVEKVCAAGRDSGKPVGMFVADESEIPQWVALGASLFLLSTDHAFMLAGARGLVAIKDG